MNNLRWNLTILSIALLAVCQITLAMPSLRQKRQNDEQITLVNLDEINPVEAEETPRQGLEREKRKLPEATFAGKNAILGFVFGDENDKTQQLKPIERVARQVQVTVRRNDDVPDLKKDGGVSLDLPDELFSQSFTTVTNLSKIVGNFMMNSARRYAKFVYWFKPLLGNSLTIEGHNYIPTTTTKKSTST